MHVDLAHCGQFALQIQSERFYIYLVTRAERRSLLTAFAWTDGFWGDSNKNKL